MIDLLRALGSSLTITYERLHQNYLSTQPDGPGSFEAARKYLAWCFHHVSFDYRSDAVVPLREDLPDMGKWQ